jgi:hypothetical protein
MLPKYMEYLRIMSRNIGKHLYLLLFTSMLFIIDTPHYPSILGAFRKPVGVKPWLGHPKYIKIKCQVVRIFGLLKNAQNRGWDGHNYYLSNDPLVMWFGWEMSEIQQKYNKNT